MSAPARWVLDERGLEALIAALRGRGYRVAAPLLRDGAVALDEIASAAELPRGVVDVQEPGRYRLEPGEEDFLFPVLHGAQSFKRFLHPARHTLLAARLANGEVALEEPPAPAGRWAFLGIRSCDLAALARLDRVLLDGLYPDAVYRRHRAGAFLVAVACERPGDTCFCVSTGTGPAPRDGFDVALTELGGGRLLAEAGSEAGASLLEELPKERATAAQLARAEESRAEAARSMGRRLAVGPLAGPLAAAAASPRWDEVGRRCLSCGNCTMVCPTCFCTNVEETTDLSRTRAERTRTWDSCHTLDFSYLHGGSVRRSAAARYRQWLTHKLSSWVDQFGTHGCVGCGRCITWCPSGIDLTVEAPAAAATPRAGRTA